jgi:hypothetical protein
MPGLVTYHTALSQQCDIVLSRRFGIVVMLDEWSIVLVLHCSHIIAACLYALQALTTLPVHTSCRPMMALISCALKTITHA